MMNKKNVSNSKAGLSNNTPLRLKIYESFSHNSLSTIQIKQPTSIEDFFQSSISSSKNMKYIQQLLNIGFVEWFIQGEFSQKCLDRGVHISKKTILDQKIIGIINDVEKGCLPIVIQIVDEQRVNEGSHTIKRKTAPFCTVIGQLAVAGVKKESEMEYWDVHYNEKIKSLQLEVALGKDEVKKKDASLKKMEKKVKNQKEEIRMLKKLQKREKDESLKKVCKMEKEMKDLKLKCVVDVKEVKMLMKENERKIRVEFGKRKNEMMKVLDEKKKDVEDLERKIIDSMEKKKKMKKYISNILKRLNTNKNEKVEMVKRIVNELEILEKDVREMIEGEVSKSILISIRQRLVFLIEGL